MLAPVLKVPRLSFCLRLGPGRLQLLRRNGFAFGWAKVLRPRAILLLLAAWLWQAPIFKVPRFLFLLAAWVCQAPCFSLRDFTFAA